MLLVSQGLKGKDEVLHAILSEMKRVYDMVASNSSKLEEHVVARFSPAQRAAQHQAAAAATTLITANFTRCGQCLNMCDLQQIQARQYPPFQLYCSTCPLTLKIPSGAHVALQHICPICQFQVLSVSNTERNTSYNVCPYCFNNPPAGSGSGDIEDGGAAQQGANFSQGFRCFQCTKPDCTLSNKYEN